MTNAQSESIATARSLLFVPGSRPELFAKAATSGADGIVLDLEDAVAPELKDVAREHVRCWLADGGGGLVRINDATTEWHEQDLTALGDRPRVVMLPKTGSPAQVADLLDRLPTDSQVLPILETAEGVLDAAAICACPGVVRAAFGNGDLSSELGVDHTNWAALAFARSMIVLASAASGVASPLDGVTVDVADDEVLVADAQYAATLGFTGKLCIHPRQIPSVHTVFTPSDQDVRWAHDVLSAAQDGSVALVDGKMIDKPIVKLARRVLAHSARRTEQDDRIRGHDPAAPRMAPPGAANSTRSL